MTLHLSLTPINRGLKRRSPGQTAPRTVWKPHVHRLLTDWLRLLEPAAPGGRSSPIPGSTFLSPDQVPSPHLQLTTNSNNPGASYPTGQRRPAEHGDDKIPSPDRKSFHTSYTTPRARRRKRTSLGSIPRRKVWKSQPHRLMMLVWLGLFMEPARGESSPSGQR